MKLNWVHRLVLSILFSIINWLIIDSFWIEMSFIEYFIIELIVVVSLKLYIFTGSKFGIINNK